MTLNEKIKEIISRNLKALESDLYLCEANETGDMWRKYVDYISKELTTLIQQELKEVVEGFRVELLDSSKVNKTTSGDMVVGYNDLAYGINGKVDNYLERFLSSQNLSSEVDMESEGQNEQ